MKNTKLWIFLSLWLSVLTYCLGTSAQAQGFVAPLPPPELGQKLTDYRTPEQQATERGFMGNSNANSYLRQRSANFDAQVPQKNSRQPQVKKEELLLNDVDSTYDYTPNKKVILTRGGEAVIKLHFVNAPQASIEKLKVNSGFRTEINDNEIKIWPTGITSQSKLVITIKLNGHRQQLFFELKCNERRFEERHNEIVRVRFK